MQRQKRPTGINEEHEFFGTAFANDCERGAVKGWGQGDERGLEPGGGGAGAGAGGRVKRGRTCLPTRGAAALALRGQKHA